ncbi:hypothetical protein ACLMJK_005502 [Lecanora helva]
MEPIAVVGLALKFPQDATSLEGFWDMLVEQRCAMTDFPSSRLNVDAFYHPNISQRGTLPLRGGHFIKEDLGAFDAGFFSISPTEAAAMDPAQRGLLETAYRAFENAGIPVHEASGSNTSVHTGCFTDDYKLQMLKDPDQIPKYAATGASLAMLANRLSWFFNLAGPSMNIDSACSSSGIAVDYGCQLLRNKDCDMSLIAGCNITFVSDYTSILTKMGFLSPDSRCYTFDHRANGYARGEGIGVILLKRLSDALRDRNTIRAVIRSSGSNQDAHTPGITQPSSRAQERLIKETYRKAKLSMEHTRFVEAHGTGTKIGDTIETSAIGNAFKDSRSLEDPLYVGAVKTNIGHLEGASGLAGLIKAIMILETGVMLPNTNFESRNKRIDTEFLKISLPLNCLPWPTDGLRRISVNSFGFGGSNSHVILDDAFNYLRRHNLSGIHCTRPTPPKNLESESRPTIRFDYHELSSGSPRPDSTGCILRTPKLLVVSAADEEGLKRIAAQYEVHLAKVRDQNIDEVAYLHNLAYTLDSYSIANVDDLAQQLSVPVTAKATPPRLGFVFTGQGAQWPAMGQELLQYPTYAESVDSAGKFLGGLGCAWSPRDELTKCVAETNVHDPAYSQTLCTIVQVALVDLLDGIGIAPCAVIGHSSGEISAANVTISGPDCQIGLLEAMFSKDKVFARKLKVGVAYHSRQMDHVAKEYSNLIGEVSRGNFKPAVPMVSSVTKLKIDPKELRKKDYWVKNMISLVQFFGAMQRLCSQDRKSLTKKLDGSHRDAIYIDHLIEVGPHSALRAPIRDCLEYAGRGDTVDYNSVLQRNKSAFDTFLDLAGHLHSLDVPVKIRSINDPDPKFQDSRITLVDLPEYPFDHSVSYWHESRISSDYRLRHYGPVELLGTPSPNWNPLDAQWRNLIHSIDLPWAQDHKINGVPLCPGAGMIIMAIEAITQVADPAREIVGYALRDIVFGVALDLSSTSANTETRFALRSSKDPAGQEHSWYSFSIYSLKDEEWTEHCTGKIQLQYDSQEDASNYKALLQSREKACTTPIDSTKFYDFLKQRGIDYGPAFRRLNNIRGSKDQILADVSLLKVANNSLAKLKVIHPATLDAVLHSVFAAQSNGATKEIDTQVPTAIRNIWISHEGLGGGLEDSIAITTNLETTTPLNSTFSSIGYDKHSSHLRILVDELQMSTVASSAPAKNQRPGDTQVWTKFQFPVDLELLSTGETKDFLINSSPSPYPEPVAFYKDLRLFLRGILGRTKANLRSSKAVCPQPHLQKYINWIDYQLTSEKSCFSQHIPDTQIKELDCRIRKEGPIGLLYSKVAENLDTILDGRTDALRLLFEDDLVEDFYAASAKSSVCFERLHTYIAALASKRPDMQIMEIGSGTGVFTNIVFDALSLRDEGCAPLTMFNNYHFTDISPSFFDSARIKFSGQQHKMTFSVFDIEKDIESQGQKEGSYDIIIAANVLHLAKDLTTPLKSIRRLLKPGGKLVLHETTTPRDITTGFVFGLLQDWWVSAEPDRRMSPLMAEHDWCSLLTKSGFSGTDIVLRDFEDESCHQSTIMVSTAIEDLRPLTRLPAVSIVVDDSTSMQRLLAEKVIERLRTDHDGEASILQYQDALHEPSPGAVQVFLMDTASPFLSQLDENRFSNLKSFVSNATQMFWITDGGGCGIVDPSFGMIDGFARALRLERNDLKLVTLALDPAVADIGRKAENIIQVLTKSFLSADGPDYEREYFEIAGKLHLKRLEPASSMKNKISEQLHQKQINMQTLGECKPFKINVPKPGQLDSIDFISKADSVAEDLRADEIEVEVEAVGLDLGDVTQALGLTDTVRLGNECAGFVRRTSVNNTSAFKVGDRVCMLGADFCQSHARASQELVATIPDGLTFEQASVLPFRSWLASYLVNEIARLRKDETVLIHDGASPVGQLAIRLAQGTEATIYTTVPTEEDRAMLGDTHKLPQDRVFLADAFMSRPSPIDLEKRCDVVLCLSEVTDHLSLIKSMRPFGKYIYLTKAGSPVKEEDLSSSLPRNTTLHIADPLSLSDAYLNRVHRPLSSIIDQVGTTLSGIQTIESHRVSHTTETLRQVRDLDERSRVVIRMDKDDTIPLTKAVKPGYQFDPQSTYLISGGLGGIGRCVARWMVSRGALNLILLSRSGPKSKVAIDMISEMTGQGVRVETPSCDAADQTALLSTLDECSKILPPIKGCIQASGVIQDIWFEKMSFEDWTAVTRPKVQASWNLHNALPKGMDFFILTASISGILGQITQVNYASGNTYQDALAKYRIDQGEKAISLDLGLLLIDGLLKDKPELVERLNSTGHFIPIAEPELIAIFDHYCDPNLQLASPRDAQPVVGIQSAAILRGQGIQLPQSMEDPLWSIMKCSDNGLITATETKDHQIDLGAMISKAASTTEAGTLATEAMIKKVAQLLSMPPEKLDADRFIHHYGVDSLTAVDVRNWISKTFAVQLSTFEIMGNTTFNNMGLTIVKQCKQK